MTMPARPRPILLAGIAAALARAAYALAPTRTPVSAPTSAPDAPAAPPPNTPPPAAIIVPVAPPEPPPVARGSIPGLSVNATFATRAGGGSILVTRADGSRALVAAGTEAAPGIRLTAVAADRATFTAGITRFWIPLQSPAAAQADPGPAVTPVAAPAVVPAAAPAATAALLRESQAYQAALAPRTDGAYRGYAVRGTTPLFARAGLKPGDVITGINGRAFDSPAEIAQLAREAAISATVTFQIRRDGKTQELQVQPR